MKCSAWSNFTVLHPNSQASYKHSQGACEVLVSHQSPMGQTWVMLESPVGTKRSLISSLVGRSLGWWRAMNTTDQVAISPQLISIAATHNICCGGTLCTLSTISWLWEVFSPALPGEDSEESPSSESMSPLSDRPYPLWKDTSPPPAWGSSGNTLLQGLQEEWKQNLPHRVAADTFPEVAALACAAAARCQWARCACCDPAVPEEPAISTRERKYSTGEMREVCGKIAASGPSSPRGPCIQGTDLNLIAEARQICLFGKRGCWQQLLWACWPFTSPC